MKIMMLVSELEDYTISFVNGVASHVPVTLAVPRRRYAHLASCFDRSVDLHLMDWPRHRALSNPLFLLTLTRLIKKEAPSLIHLLSNTTLWLNFAAPFWRPTPLVTTVHDIRVHPGDTDTSVLPRWATDLMIRQSRDVVVHGEGLRKLLLEQYRKPADHVHVLSHPTIRRYADIAAESGLKRDARDNTFRLLMFGRIFAYKGLEHLIHAEAILADSIPNLRITIAGRGDDPWALRPLMADPSRYDIRNRFIDDAEVAQLFTDADVVVLPYTEASQSGVLNLAAAFGKPVIVTDVGELRASVGSNGLGLVVPPADPDQLARAIWLIANDRRLREQSGASALAWATGPNSAKAVGACATSLYRKVLDECALN